MEQINKLELVGNVGTVREDATKPENVINFTIANNYMYTTAKGEARVETLWLNVSAFKGKNIIPFEQITKGQSLHVIGRLKMFKYTTADGSERNGFELVANKIELAEDFAR